MVSTLNSQTRLKLILVAILAVLSFNTWFLYLNFKEVAEQDAWVLHTAEVLYELEQVASAVKDAETGSRGYLLTGDEDHLESYRTGSLDVWAHFNVLREITADNHDQQSRLTQLETVIKRRLEILSRLVEETRARDGKFVSPKASKFSEGKVAMAMLRRNIEEIKTAEQRLMNARSETTSRSKKIFGWALVVTTLLSAIVISLTVMQIARHQRRTLEENEQKSREARENDVVAEAARLVAGDTSLENVSLRSLEFFSTRFGMLAGRIFMREQAELRPIAMFGVKELEADAHGARAGLIKAAASRADLWQVSDVPADYWHISSSLGESKPRTLLFVPIIFQGENIGVVEMAFFEEPAAETKSAIAKLRETLGIGLNAAQSRGHLQALLERTQQQSEELQAQQEELKTNNEELEQQARALESQQQSLNMKNRELERAQGELEQKASDLEKSSQYKSDFLAKMSHELRTPLNGLLILSTLLIENKERNLTSQQTQFARSIHSAGNDLLLLINDILDLSKIEARKLTLKKDDFTLESLMNSKRLTFGPQATSKGLALEITMPDSLKGLHLHTDRQRLEQILRNFMSNAIKFTDSGHVRLNASINAAKTRIQFVVEDTGIGIPKSKQAAIFEAFEQGDSSVSRKYGGTGLGLTISRELATLLGGEISVTSEEGKGSRFNLTIPIELPTAAGSIDAPRPSVLASPSSKEASSPSGLKQQNPARFEGAVGDVLKGISDTDKSILIVEDDDAFRTSVTETVKTYGFKPIEAADGEFAMALLNEHTPKAILLDIKLPGISGLGLLEMIKQIPRLRHVPVHMISALEYQHSALRMGALGYLTKPVTIEKVRSALGRIEGLLSKQLKKVLLIEDDERQSHAISQLIAGDDIEVKAAKTGKEAVNALKSTGYDCIILDLTLPDVSGFDLLSELSALEVSLPPIVIYTGKDLTDAEEAYLRRFSESIIIKGVRSPERLLDEVNLFLHRVESMLPLEQREMLSHLRSQEKSFEGKTVLVVDDDIRNVFALTSALEARGLGVEVARDGVEALETLARNEHIDLVVMDIMMPRMDGYETMREIRKSKNDRVRGLPIVALTAKAMREDHEKCMEAGANDYLPKPVNLDNLTTVLKVWLAPQGIMG